MQSKRLTTVNLSDLPETIDKSTSQTEVFDLNATYLQILKYEVTQATEISESIQSILPVQMSIMFLLTSKAFTRA